MRPIEFGDRVLLAGPTRKGKSTMARYLTLRLQPCRTIICDPKRSGAMDVGLPTCDTNEQLFAHLADPIVRWCPVVRERDLLEEAFWAIWELPGPYLLLIDETSLVSTPNWCPAGLAAVVCQGAEHKKMLIACTQRLKMIATVIRSETTHTIVMVPAPVEHDLQAISGHVGQEPDVIRDTLIRVQQTHGDYAHIWHTEGDQELTECAPLPAAAVTGWPLPPGARRGRPPAAEEASGAPASADQPPA